MRTVGGEESVGREASTAPAGRRANEYGTIIVVGGGCYGSYYVRQLVRARDAGALSFERLVAVDRDPECRVARVLAGGGARSSWSDVRGPPHRDDALPLELAPHQTVALRVEIADWADFFRRYLGAAAADPARVARDAIVPSPLMPHLMYDWLLDRARVRWPSRAVRTVPLERAPSTPWQRGAESGSHYVSFAEWMCPINCVEPPLCPEIRGPRSWSMPVAVRAYVEAERDRGRPLAGPLLLRCLHRAYGVGMFDTIEVLAADAELARVGGAGAARVLVGTVSHCHGALNLLELDGPD